MKIIKKTDAFNIIQKKSGRYGVKASNGKWLNGEEKVKILLAEGLIKVTAPAPKAVEEAPAEAAAEEAPAE